MELPEMHSIGRITKTHGIKGAVILRGVEELQSLLEGQKVVFLDFDGYPVPFFPEEMEFLSPDTAIIRFRDIGSPVKTEELPGREVYLPEIRGTGRKDFSIQQLEGYKVQDVQSGVKGIVTGVVDYKLNPLLEVRNEDHTFLIPFTAPVVIKIDHAKKVIRVNLPEGLVDLNKRGN